MTWGLLATAVLLGLRHGIDWDHIAAIGDLSSSASSRRQGLWLSLLYALGHAAVVFALGAAAVVAGSAIPESLDVAMGYAVGASLIALGAWVLVSLVRHGRDFRMRSRWMLILGGTFAGLRRVRRRRGNRTISVDHQHDHVHADEPHDAGFAHDHAHTTGVALDDHARVAAGTSGMPRPLASDVRGHHHAHPHHHELAIPSTPGGRYGSGTATGIGMLHGIGMESPTQIAVFVASTSVAGAGAGLTLLVAWVVGLVVSNAALALAAGLGVFEAQRSFKAYATVAVVVAVTSIVVGASYLVGLALPAITR